MLQHVLRRMGFGASTAELDAYSRVPLVGVIGFLLNYDRAPGDVDEKINGSGYVGVTTRGQFSPNTAINDARQRWLFRMIHTQRPLQEKLALFWHNHFATAFSKVGGTVGQDFGTALMDGDPKQLAGHRGQIQLFRDMAMERFDELLIAVAKDPAMLIWLDGRLNVRARPQENFGRELMELFTTGVGHYTEEDVYAAARVFTGWNLRVFGDRSSALTTYYEYVFNVAQHDTTAKTFTFAVMPDGSRTIPGGRTGAEGEQDGIDLIRALARRPQTAERLARRFYAYFVSEFTAPSDALIAEMREAYLQNDTSIKAMLVRLFTSEEFLAESSEFSRYSWPVEFVVRAIKETGWTGLSVDAAMTPLVNMGQQLYEPPDVNGWALGPEWFSTVSMLSRMNFAAALMSNQRFNLQGASTSARSAPEALLDLHMKRFASSPWSADAKAALLDYLRQGGTWPLNDAQLANKASGLARLIVGSAEYQFN